KMRPAIDDHDFNVKARAARRFLEQGDKVKATIMFRGRELAHVSLGQKVLERLLESVKDVCQVERAPRMEGRNMTMILVPKPQDRAGNKKNAQEQ
ncbi:MAG TPA: translation initiation factor IF-3, partial [Firmicutes bacterium]|nr:translation initiation factor IF-3 [Candidatus Fermentithermobacillaceae bacterium]